MDQQHQVGLVVPGEVGHEGLARFGGLDGPALAEGSLLEHLPSCGWDEPVGFLEGDEVHVGLGGFEEDEVASPVLVEVTGGDVMKEAVLDGCLIAIELAQFPGLAGELLPGDTLGTEEGDGIGVGPG